MKTERKQWQLDSTLSSQEARYKKCKIKRWMGDAVLKSSMMIRKLHWRWWRTIPYQAPERWSWTVFATKDIHRDIVRSHMLNAIRREPIGTVPEANSQSYIVDWGRVGRGSQVSCRTRRRGWSTRAQKAERILIVKCWLAQRPGHVNHHGRRDASCNNFAAIRRFLHEHYNAWSRPSQ